MRQAALHLEHGAVVKSATRDNRYRTARIIFLGALAFNAALTAFWLHISEGQLLLGALILCVTVVTANGLGTPWLFVSLILATSNCVLEQYSLAAQTTSRWEPRMR